MKQEGKYKISHNQIKKWIQKQESYSRNKGVKRKFQRGRVIVSGIDDQFDADLASFISYADENDHWRIWGACQAHPLLWNQILLFSHTFLPKSTHIGGPYSPPNGSMPPLWEILDLPLMMVINIYR